MTKEIVKSCLEAAANAVYNNGSVASVKVTRKGDFNVSLDIKNRANTRKFAKLVDASVTLFDQKKSGDSNFPYFGDGTEDGAPESIIPMTDNLVEEFKKGNLSKEDALKVMDALAPIYKEQPVDASAWTFSTLEAASFGDLGISGLKPRTGVMNFFLMAE